MLYYALGFLALLLVILISVSLPKWYSKWQDHTLMSEVTVEKMDRIQFLDTDLLDIVARLKLLSQSQELYIDEDIKGYLVTDLGVSIEKCRENYQKFAEGNLLPAEAAEVIDEANLFSYDVAYAELSSGIIPLWSLCFVGDSAIVFLVVDSDNGFFYYAGVSGDIIMDEIARNMGGEDYESWYGQLEEGTYSLDQAPDVTTYDFASVCGAEGQETEPLEGTGMYLVSTLDFEDFTCTAYRQLFYCDGLEGISVMFGTDIWQYIAYSTASSTGFTAWEVYPEDWVDIWNSIMEETGNDQLFIERYSNSATIAGEKEQKNAGKVYDDGTAYDVG